MERPRIVFMGTPELAVPSLLACQQVGEVVAVVTQPDRPKGRGQAVQPSAVKLAAEAAGLSVLQPPRLKGTDFALTLAALRPEVTVVTAYGRILPPDVLAAPRRGSLNVHASLLPRWRGAAPIQWAIAEGDTQTGVCLMQMEAGLDTGPVLAVRREAISADDTAASLGARLAALGGALLREELPRFFAGQLTAVPQPEAGVTLARMVEKRDGFLDFRLPARGAGTADARLHPMAGCVDGAGRAAFEGTPCTAGRRRGNPGHRARDGREAGSGLRRGVPGAPRVASRRQAQDAGRGLPPRPPAGPGGPAL